MQILQLLVPQSRSYHCGHFPTAAIEVLRLKRKRCASSLEFAPLSRSGHGLVTVALSGASAVCHRSWWHVRLRSVDLQLASPGVPH